MSEGSDSDYSEYSASDEEWSESSESSFSPKPRKIRKRKIKKKRKAKQKYMEMENESASTDESDNENKQKGKKKSQKPKHRSRKTPSPQQVKHGESPKRTPKAESTAQDQELQDNPEGKALDIGAISTITGAGRVSCHTDQWVQLMQYVQ